MDENLEKEPEKEEEKKELEKEEKIESEEEPKKEEKEPEEEVKQEVKEPVVDKKKEGSFKPIIFVMIASLAIAMFWDKIPFIKDSVHAALDPTAGWLLLNLNVALGMIIIVFFISSLTTLIQKYATDQKALRELKKEQKILQEEMKKYKEHPAKMAELSKNNLHLFQKPLSLLAGQSCLQVFLLFYFLGGLMIFLLLWETLNFLAF